MRVATHNVKVDLPDPRAADCVRLVLQKQPDLFGLQEWGRSRRSVLKNFGTVVAFPRLRRLWIGHPDAGYVFVYPLGGQPVGVDASKWNVNTVRRIKLSNKRPGVRPTYGTEVQVRPQTGGPTVAILNVHPVAHHDRPENKAAWDEAVASIEEWADSWSHFRRFVVGDVNKDGLDLHGLTSCWDGHDRDKTGPHGGTIDEIFTTSRSDVVTVIDTPSDHNAVVADYAPKEIHP